MYVIGLTGGIGSGKSTVAELFAKKGITIIDTDVIARQLTEPGQPALQAIIAHFGKNMANADGSLNRAALRKLVFKNPEKKHWLENLLHPLIRVEMKKIAKNATSPYCIAVVPLLVETEKNPLINRILVVDTTPELQLQRAKARDNVPHDEIELILRLQVSRLDRLAHANDVIHNKGSVEDLIPQVDKLHQLYLSFAK